MHSKIITLGILLASPVMLQSATIVGNLGGLTNPTGSATNGDNTRQFSWVVNGTDAAAGAQVTVNYTLDVSEATPDLASAFPQDAIFRYSNGKNVPSTASLTITIDSISINSGWTLDAVSMTDTVTVASLEGGKTARFSVNGGATFDYLGTGSAGTVSGQSVTNSEFQNFNSVGDSIFFQNVNQTTNGGMNLKNLSMTFEVIPEPSSALLLGLGLGWLTLFRRRHSR